MESSQRAPVLILGLGNVLLRDEGIGVHVAAELKRRSLPPSVEVIDGGTAGADLLNCIASRRKVVVVDAVQAGREPGSVFLLLPQDLDDPHQPPLSLHEVGFLQALSMARCLGCEPAETVIVGVQPQDLTPGLDLSPALRPLVNALADLALSEAQG